MSEIVVIVLGFIIGITSFLFLMSSVLNDFFKEKFSRVFKSDLKSALAGRQLSAQQILTLAESRHLDSQTTSRVAKQLLGDLLVDPDGKPEQIAQLEAYLSHMKAIEPFEGVPSELRIHLERLKDQTPSLGSLLDPLAMQIKELAYVRSREAKIQKYYTAGGFFVGIAGIVLAVWMYTNPQEPHDTNRPPSESTVVEPTIAG